MKSKRWWIWVTVKVENSFPFGHTRRISRLVPETTPVLHGLLYKQPLLSCIASFYVLEFRQLSMSHCNLPKGPTETGRMSQIGSQTRGRDRTIKCSPSTLLEWQIKALNIDAYVTNGSFENIIFIQETLAFASQISLLQYIQLLQPSAQPSATK